MNKTRFILLILLIASFLLPSVWLNAQNAVVNPQFSTMDLQHWRGTDPSMYVATGPQYLGMEAVCLCKSPGIPYNNGSIAQEVHLIAGYTYHFSARIAAQYYPD